MNFLTENKIEQYADLVSRIEEVAAESEQAADVLKGVEKRLADMAVLMKHVATYQKTKPVYDAYFFVSKCRDYIHGFLDCVLYPFSKGNVQSCKFDP